MWKQKLSFKILLPWRRVTKRLALRLQRERERKKDTATSSERSALSRAMFAARSLSFRETVLYHLAAQNCCAVTIIFICMPKGKQKAKHNIWPPVKTYFNYFPREAQTEDEIKHCNDGFYRGLAELSPNTHGILNCAT